MAVRFTGGTSGNREDALPQVPSGGQAQPVLDTDTSGPVPSSIVFNSHRARPHSQARTADFMPTGCSPVGGTDVEDPGATTGGDERVFRGAPNTGVKGGPA